MRIATIALSGLLAASVTQAQYSREPLSPVGQKIQQAMHSDARTDAEKARDANRKPIQTLEFFGLQDNMRVVELVPEGGWYTKILAPVLAEKGHLYLAIGTRQLGTLLKDHPGMSKAEVLPLDGVHFAPTAVRGIFELGELSLGVTDIDLVLTFRNLHNFNTASQLHMHQAAFAALKPGGYYGVIDHTRRHNQPFTVELWRRLDPVTVIQQIQEAGFELADSSDLHYRADDELRYDTRRKSVNGNSDRFMLLFRKPMP
jgi:predicted methyltransferase